MDNNFDLFVGMCNEPAIDIASFIDKVKASEIGKYINIRPIDVNEDTIRLRNISAGSIQLIAYLSAKGIDEPAVNWGTSFSRVGYICSEGVCVFSHNINSKVNSCTKESEDILVNRIVNAFYFILDICKKLKFNITGDDLGDSNYS